MSKFDRKCRGGRGIGCSIDAGYLGNASSVTN